MRRGGERQFISATILFRPLQVDQPDSVNGPILVADAACDGGPKRANIQVDEGQQYFDVLMIKSELHDFSLKAG